MQTTLKLLLQTVNKDILELPLIFGRFVVRFIPTAATTASSTTILGQLALLYNTLERNRKHKISLA